MSDALNLPVTDEQAKALQEAFKLGSQGLETARAAGGYLARILGTLPEDLIGILGADRIRARRVENMIGLAISTEERLNTRHVSDRQPATLSVALPILEYAADESREEIVDLWARLLAAAMDPSKSKRVRQTFIAAVKGMDPVDALTLNFLPTFIFTQDEEPQHGIARQISASPNEVSISLVRLLELGCIYDGRGRGANTALTVQRPLLTPFGTEMLAVLRD